MVEQENKEGLIAALNRAREISYISKRSMANFPRLFYAFEYDQIIRRRFSSHMLTRLLVKRLFLLWLFTVVPFVDGCAQYRHKSEAEIAAMTPAQRIDEYANEQAFHKFDILDKQNQLISKYLRRDGLNALPRMIEIMNEYDPVNAAGRDANKGERFDAMWMFLGELDNQVVRLRASAEGRQAIQALERAIARMRAAGAGKKDQQEWAEHGRFDLASTTLQDAKGVNATDEAIQDTLRISYKIRLSNQELRAFTNSLVSRDAGYPGWSDMDLIKDYSRMNEAGNPAQVYILKTPERFYEAYLEFKKQKK